MAEYKLYYFPLRGRAELTRLLFVAGGKKFDDVRIPSSEWPEKKKSFPNGKLPMLEVGGLRLTQSLAIARHVANVCGLAGKTPTDQALVDQIVLTVNELLEDYILYFMQTDTQKKKDMLDKLMKDHVPNKLETLEDWLKQNNGGDGYFVGPSMTMADIAVYEDLTSVLQKDTNLLDKYPKLAAHRQRIAGSPRIKEYLAKRQCTEA